MTQAGKTFVLVHGAWHGGWCWRRVADLLTAAGHRVFAPTLTGLGERSHLLGPSVSLSTHIVDVVNVMRWERLKDVVLVGHSYGGIVISGVAEKMPGSIASIVYLDAFVPENGQCMTDVSERARGGVAAAAQANAIAVPPVPAVGFGVNERDREWVDALCTPHPVGSLTEKISLTGAYDRIPRKTYIRAKSYPNPAFDRCRDRSERAGWAVHDVGCGHDVMIDAPQELAKLLCQ
jgi:pimeloyl-ACP methyl ester carboxylesterase